MHLISVFIRSDLNICVRVVTRHFACASLHACPDSSYGPALILSYKEREDTVVTAAQCQDRRGSEGIARLQGRCQREGQGDAYVPGRAIMGVGEGTQASVVHS